MTDLAKGKGERRVIDGGREKKEKTIKRLTLIDGIVECTEVSVV